MTTKKTPKIKKSKAQSAVVQTVPEVKQPEPVKVQTVQPVETPKLEIKRFTEQFTSTDPFEQIDQIVKFYNSFSVGKDFLIKFKVPVTAETPDVYLKLIYAIQEQYIKHLNRLPFAEELRNPSLIRDVANMKESVAHWSSDKITQYDLALSALGLKMPLTLHMDQKPRTI